MVISDGNSRNIKGINSSVLYYIINHMQYGIAPVKKGTLDQLNTRQEKKQWMKSCLMTHKKGYVLVNFQ